MATRRDLARRERHATAIGALLKRPAEEIHDMTHGRSVQVVLDYDKPMIGLVLASELLKTHGIERAWRTLYKWHAEERFRKGDTNTIAGKVFLDPDAVLRVAREMVGE